MDSSRNNHKYDAVVIGAGAAGLMCAIEAGKRKRRVLVLEHADRVGKKILISGGGRCNFTNLRTGADNFISSNPHFAKSALARYQPEAFVRLVEKHGIPYHEKKLGQMFCDRSANDIVTMLETECRDAGVEIHLNAKVGGALQKQERFEVDLGESTVTAKNLVVAAGGLSISKIGATSFGYDLARQFGLAIQPTRPALVPFVFHEKDRRRWCDLSGVSVDVIASTRNAKHSFREKMLFTHRGLSGPAILQISSYWQSGECVRLDLAPGSNLVEQLKTRGRRDESSWKTTLREVFSRRLADRWIEVYPPTGASDHALAEAERQLHAWEVYPEGTEGYGKAEVTAGGVDTSELSAQTMESKKVSGLFFVGEVVDVTGQLGGFNFQWAWASGYCAGQVI